MKILIGADLVPTKTNFELFSAGDAVSLVGDELLEILQEAEYRIFNLELPLCDNPTPIEKCGPALIAPTETVAGYKAIGADILTLANNHILDQGQDGLHTTLTALDEAGIDYIGVGTLDVAKRAKFIRLGEKKVGIYACAEHEFSIATDKTAGANPFDPLNSLDHIAKASAECDYLIVLYHGGKEHYRYPSPYLQKVCRRIVEKGADLVVCQHSHCVGCEEKYNDGTIVYGQGNFLFDYSESEYWQTGMLVAVDETGEVSYIPLRKEGNAVRIAGSDESAEIIENFHRRSDEIKQDGFVAKKYEEFADSMIKNYLISFSGLKRNFFYKVFDKLSGHRLTDHILKSKYNKTKKLALLNFIECEAHRELLLRGLKNNK